MCLPLSGRACVCVRARGEDISSVLSLGLLGGTVLICCSGVHTSQPDARTRALSALGGGQLKVLISQSCCHSQNQLIYLGLQNLSRRPHCRCRELMHFRFPSQVDSICIDLFWHGASWHLRQVWWMPNLDKLDRILKGLLLQILLGGDFFLFSSLCDLPASASPGNLVLLPQVARSQGLVKRWRNRLGGTVSVNGCLFFLIFTCHALRWAGNLSRGVTPALAQSQLGWDVWCVSMVKV